MLILTLGIFAQAASSITESNSTSSDSGVIIDVEDNGIESISRCARGGKWNSERGGCVYPSTTSNKWVGVSLTPEKQTAEAGETVKYSFKIEDRHKPKVCDGEICATVMDQYTYDIDVEKNHDMVVEFDENEVTLLAGEGKKITFTVSSEKKGANVFSIEVESEDGRARTKGLLLVGKDEEFPTPPVQDTSLIVGSGFLLSDDESVGKVVELKIFDDENTLKGRAAIGNKDMRVEGTLAGEAVVLNFYKPEGNEVLATFSGSIREYHAFKLLKGDFDSSYDGLEDGTLSVISRSAPVFRNVVFEKGEKEVREKAKLKEVLALKKRKLGESEEIKDKEIYVRPVKIRKGRFLYVIPNPWGKKVLEFEIIDGEKVLKKTISARGEKEVEGYKFKVGALEDEENIELEIEEVD
jgi:hypothetical protein